MRFRRALDRGNVTEALSAASEIQFVRLAEALELTLLLADEEPAAGAPGHRGEPSAKPVRVERIAETGGDVRGRVRDPTRRSERENGHAKAEREKTCEAAAHVRVVGPLQHKPST